MPLTDQECCYAKWTPNTYTIKFDLDDGMGEIDDIVATYDVEIDLPAITFEKAHYNFVGWKDSDKEIFYSINGKVKNLTRENNGTVVLKAVWQMQKYSITFDDNGADNGNMDDIELEYDQKVNIPTNTFTKVGYLFNGWLYNGKTYQNEEEISMLCESEDTITLTAQWKPITYTIRFEFEGQNSYEQKFTYDSRQELLPVGFVKEYFAFSGWFCPTKSLYFADQEEILNLSEEEGQILVFTAQFRECRFRKLLY